MPTTIGSLLVFVASLTPGFVYLMRTETRLPGRRYTPVRETALIVSASLAAYGVVLSIFWVVRVALPTRTPEVGLLILDPPAYFQDHYGEATLWATSITFRLDVMPLPVRDRPMGRRAWLHPSRSRRSCAPRQGSTPLRGLGTGRLR